MWKVAHKQKINRDGNFVLKSMCGCVDERERERERAWISLVKACDIVECASERVC